MAQQGRQTHSELTKLSANTNTNTNKVNTNNNNESENDSKLRKIIAEQSQTMKLMSRIIQVQQETIDEMSKQPVSSKQEKGKEEKEKEKEKEKKSAEDTEDMDDIDMSNMTEEEKQELMRRAVAYEMFQMCQPPPEKSKEEKSQKRVNAKKECAALAQVHLDLIQKLGFKHPKSTCLCTRVAIAKGFITLDTPDPNTNPNTNTNANTNAKTDPQSVLNKVVFKGECHGCSTEFECTLEQALDQPDAGYDYDNGGEGASLQCEYCGGNYLTGLCENKPKFDCGKYHNHCTDCEGFGECLHDYRESHCSDCGNHFFEGLSGLECDCKGGMADAMGVDMNAVMGALLGIS